MSDKGLWGVTHTRYLMILLFKNLQKSYWGVPLLFCKSLFLFCCRQSFHGNNTMFDESSLTARTAAAESIRICTCVCRS